MEARDEAELDGCGESRKRKAEPGSGFPELGAPKGRTDLTGGGSEADGRWSYTGRTTRDGAAEEILEGERKARSVIQVNQATDAPAIRGNTSGSTPKGEKDVDGAGKPNERLPRMVKR